MEYNFIISRQDLRIADKKSGERLLKVTPQKYKLIAFIKGVLLWIPVGFCWMYIKQLYGIEASNTLAAAVGSIVLSWVLSTYLNQQSIKIVLDQYRKDTIKASICIGNDNFKFEVDGNTYTIKKSSILDIEITQEQIFLYLEPISCFIIPKLGFSSVERYEALCKVLSEKMMKDMEF